MKFVVALESTGSCQERGSSLLQHHYGERHHWVNPPCPQTHSLLIPQLLSLGQATNSHVCPDPAAT